MMGNSMMNGSGEMMSGWGGGMFVGPVIMLGVLALSIFAVVMLTRWVIGSKS